MKDTPGVTPYVRGVVILPGGSGAVVLHKGYTGREGETVIVGNSKRTANTAEFFSRETGRKKS